jgi:hypothetical protein
MESIKENSCSDIHTNADIIFNNNEEKFYCDDASSIFEFEFECVWQNHSFSSGSGCGKIVHLLSEGMIFSY